MESSKGRASFVDRKRKSLTLNNIFNETGQEELKAEKHSIKSYLESLKKEKKDWKDILREKKSKQKDYEGLYKAAPMVITEADVEKFITNDDKKFMELKPNYLQMMESARKYIDAVKYLNRYKSDIIDYYNKIYDELEIDKMILVEEMCAGDVCEICNIKNCQKEEHKFIN